MRVLLLLLGGVVVNAVVTGFAWWRLPRASLVGGTALDPAAAAPMLARLDQAPDEPIVERWRSWGLTVIEAGGRYDLHELDPQRPASAAKGSITLHDAAVRVSFGWPLRCVFFERYSMEGQFRVAVVLEHVVRDKRIGRRRRSPASGARDFVWRGHRSRPWGAVIPVGVHGMGMIANVLVYAVGLWLVGRGVRAAHRAIRRWRGRCPACGYPRGGSPVCTECGERLLTPAPPPEAPASS